MKAFSEQPESFWTLLTERIIANRISGERLHAAVNYLIDHHTYPRITVADVIGFDKTLRLYSYREVYSMIVDKHEGVFDDFVKVHRRKDGSFFFAFKSDLE